MNTMLDLKEKGFVALSYPKDLRSAVNKTVESWKRFCDLPELVKKNLPYSNNADGVGYELKMGVGNKADHKENFDITLGGKEWVVANAKHIKDPVALEFIEDAVALVGVMKPMVLDFARQAEETFGLKHFTETVEKGEDVFFVRFIHYFGDRKVGEETASAHADQSGFTLHLFESDPGLQCMTYDGRWIDMLVSEGETVIIPSMQMQLFSKGILRALCHRVIVTPQTAEHGRYAAVCFVQLKGIAKYDKDAHGRLQEKAPGFNYEMSHRDFSGLFK